MSSDVVWISSNNINAPIDVYCTATLYILYVMSQPNGAASLYKRWRSGVWGMVYFPPITPIDLVWLFPEWNLCCRPIVNATALLSSLIENIILSISLCLQGESLRVCVHPGPSCCTSKMEDSYMAAVRSETQQKMRSYSFELKYLIAGHTKAYQGGGDTRWQQVVL